MSVRSPCMSDAMAILVRAREESCRTLCIVPMKPLARAKQRLSPVLDAGERRALSLAMLADVVVAARALDTVWVLNSDADAAAIARKGGAESRPDPTPDAGLNASLRAATADAMREGFYGVLVLSADCAGARTDDVRAIVTAAPVVIVPDREGIGTNALWRRPPDAIDVAFGLGSRAAHEQAARTDARSLAILDLPGVALDIDSPSDLVEALARGGTHTRATLLDLGYPARAGMRAGG